MHKILNKRTRAPTLYSILCIMQTHKHQKNTTLKPKNLYPYLQLKITRFEEKKSNQCILSHQVNQRIFQQDSKFEV